MPCAPRMALRRDDKPGSGCYAGCLHRTMVEEWRAAWQAWWVRAEYETQLYATELAEWVQLPGNRQPLLRDFMPRGRPAEVSR